MGKLDEGMDFLCSVYDKNFGSITEKHELVFEEDPGGNVEFLLADPPYNVQSN